jgi:atypical dual specificity phosphatase
MPPGFSWIVPNKVAGLAFPSDSTDFYWLRKNGVQLLVSLTEEPPRREWINEAGLLAVHVPVPDMTAPSMKQLDLLVETIQKANSTDLGVAVHCAAGRGRTGTVLAAYLISLGASAKDAIREVRTMRPGSIETSEQERVLEEWEQSRRG